MKEAENAVKCGHWMIRVDSDGISYGGFKWKPQGEWTKAPDWNSKPECGGGLHGQARKASGFLGEGQRVVFCRTRGERIAILSL